MNTTIKALVYGLSFVGFLCLFITTAFMWLMPEIMYYEVSPLSSDELWVVGAIKAAILVLLLFPAVMVYERNYFNHINPPG